MKILHVLDDSLPNISGYSLRSNYILKFQKQLNLDLIAVTSPNQEGSSPEEEIDGIKYYRTRIVKFLPFSFIKRNTLLKSIIFTHYLKRRIEEIIKKEGVDLIHAHSPILCGFPALAVGKKHKIPVVYEVRALWEDAAVDLGKTKLNSLRYKLSRYYETKLARQANAIVVICEGLKDEFISRGIPKDKIYVAPNGIDAEKFIPQPKAPLLLKKHNINGELVFGFIGSFFAFEGLDVFVKAGLRLIENNERIKILIVGSGQMQDKIAHLIKESKKECNFILTGKVPHELIRDYYSIADVMVYPRTRIRLTELVTPLKPLEAMSMQKTVIGSDVGGIKELIDNGKTGMLFKAGDEEDLATKMLYLIKNNQKIRELGERAREHIIKNRNWIDVAKKYKQIYENLL